LEGQDSFTALLELGPERPEPLRQLRIVGLELGHQPNNLKCNKTLISLWNYSMVSPQ
jgi:hypothetical protein